VPITAWLVSQVLKVAVNLWFERKLTLSYVLSAGGMPSSHSALVASLSACVARETGPSSPLFAAVVVFSAIVMYDAAGVRRAVGTHARVLNLLLDEVFIHHQIDEARLRELVGHTPLQVLAGALVGLLVTALMGGF
jgi:acid phosphatase family membrane protein YuiD